MSRWAKFKEKLLDGTRDANIPYDELCHFLDHHGFQHRQKATSHRKYYRKDTQEIISVQLGKNGKAKPYQVKQVREIVIKYKIG